jgi:galactokinase
MHHVPATMSGAEFLSRALAHGDHATTVLPHEQYAVQVCTAHPIFEHHRTTTFERLLSTAPTDPASLCHTLPLLGELMYQSHESYSAIGLGSPNTDLLVDLVRRQSHHSPLFGAKVTGGGCGGSVAVLASTTDSSVVDSALRSICNAYQRETGVAATVHHNTSNGLEIHSPFLLD